MSDLELFKIAMTLRNWVAISEIEDKVTDPILRKRIRDRRVRYYHREEAMCDMI